MFWAWAALPGQPAGAGRLSRCGFVAAPASLPGRKGEKGWIYGPLFSLQDNNKLQGKNAIPLYSKQRPRAPRGRIRISEEQLIRPAREPHEAANAPADPEVTWEAPITCKGVHP